MNHLAIASFFYFVAVFTLSGVEAQSTGSLMCYNCTYTSVLGFDVGEKGCSDPFNSAGISDISCDGSCVKQKLEGNIPSTTRSCYTASEGDCIQLNGVEISPGNHLYQYCCTGNLCNSAASLTFNFVAVASLCGALAAKH
ncbi:uncharacterized protein LOC110976898 [Acanthaster planci]|uniref:Uncharacterized protein LOC110976898 n=1 Tax=Acanthaster planci TaxID=133434 RepID=A0A8B7Y1X1_ACAPL|nr:uncharacterized protein LOC110976898 [Acanthaster planci]XP_022086291.1 uncharacterized protein LOC110976898 [Acanthaster planci]